MDAIPEETHERTFGRDEVDGFRLEETTVNVFLKQIILRVRVLIESILVLTLDTLLSWNFFAPQQRSCPTE